MCAGDRARQQFKQNRGRLEMDEMLFRAAGALPSPHSCASRMPKLYMIMLLSRDQPATSQGKNFHNESGP